MSTIAQLLQAGQPDLELAAVTPRVLLAPVFGTAPLLTIEDTIGGGLDITKVGYGTSPMVTVGNYEKKAGVKLSNKPTLNKIMSAGYGSPTRNLFSESGKGITYTPQETNLLNLQNSWGFTLSALSAPSAMGGITVGIPELPARLQWRCVMIAGDTNPKTGNPVYIYWIANLAEVGERQDVNAIDSDLLTGGVSLDFLTDPAVGLPVIFGICGSGWQDFNKTNNTGLYTITGLTNTVSPTGTTMTVSAGSTHTKQLTVLDNTMLDRTALCTFTSSDPTKATVSPSGLVTAVAAGTPVITAAYGGFTTTYSPTVS